MSTAALIAAGAIASIGLLLRASPATPPLVRLMFVGWVLLPFAILATGVYASRRWPTRARWRRALPYVALVVSLISVAGYGEFVPRPPRAARGFLFVLTPAVCLGVIAVAAILGRVWPRRSPRG